MALEPLAPVVMVFGGFLLNEVADERREGLNQGAVVENKFISGGMEDSIDNCSILEYYSRPSLTENSQNAVRTRYRLVYNTTRATPH